MEESKLQIFFLNIARWVVFVRMPRLQSDEWEGCLQLSQQLWIDDPSLPMDLIAEEVQDVAESADVSFVKLGVPTLATGNSEKFLFWILKNLVKPPPVAVISSVSYRLFSHLGHSQFR